MFRRLFFAVGAIALVIAGWAIQEPTTVFADEAICYEAGITFNNETGSKQTVYVAVYNLTKSRFEKSSRVFGYVKEGKKFSEIYQVDLEPHDEYRFFFSFAPINESAPVYFKENDANKCGGFTDARLNTGAADPAVIYFVNENYDIYAINNSGVGTLVLQTPYARVAQVMADAMATGVNLPINSNSAITLYALSTGTCQMNMFVPNGLFEFEFECITQVITTTS